MAILDAVSSLVGIFFCLAPVSHFLKIIKNYFVIPDFPVQLYIIARTKALISSRNFFELQ